MFKFLWAIFHYLSSGGFMFFFTVQQQTVAIVQRFGKHKMVAHAGLNFKTPLVDSVVARLDLRIQELPVRVETKTKDNVFTASNSSVVAPLTIEEDLYGGLLGLKLHLHQTSKYLSNLIGHNIL